MVDSVKWRFVILVRRCFLGEGYAEKAGFSKNKKSHVPVGITFSFKRELMVHRVLGSMTDSVGDFNTKMQ